MEPVTHVLTGALLGRSGLNRKAAYATVAMAIAAEFPDIDTVWGLRGPVESFTHHRGITHTFAGLPFEAALLVGVFYGVHRWRVRRERGETKAPVRWGVLYGLVVLALLSHLLLDFTNNYGVRPFFPFNPHWYAGSIVFIFDPYLFLLLVGALVLPGLLRLLQREITSGAGGRGLALMGPARWGLLLIASYYGVRTWEHLRAVELAQAQTLEIAAPVPAIAPDGPLPPPGPSHFLQAQRVWASPDPLSLFRWHVATDFGPSYQLSEVDSWSGAVGALGEVEPKANTAEPVLQAALRAPIARAYLDWSAAPWIDVDRAQLPGQTTVVRFRDPRFLGDVVGMRGHSPLTATVELDAQNHVVVQTMDGKVEP